MLHKLCACRCGHRLTAARAAKYDYLPYHRWTPPKRKLCACGCGKPINGISVTSRFIAGHWNKKPLKTIKCEACGKKKQILQSQKYRFCSRKCAAKTIFPALRAYEKLTRGTSRSEKSCMICGKKFLRFPHELKDGQRYFCSTKCAAKFRSNRSLYTPSSSINKQRKNVLATRERRCQKCEYSAHPEILVIHHINEIRLDGRLENLELVCPNCHEEEHLRRKTGRFTPHKRFNIEKLLAEVNKNSPHKKLESRS